MSTVTTVPGDGASEPDTVSPLPNSTLAQRRVKRSPGGRKFFVDPSLYPNVFHGPPPFLMRLDGKFSPPISY